MKLHIGFKNNNYPGLSKMRWLKTSYPELRGINDYCLPHGIIRREDVIQYWYAFLKHCTIFPMIVITSNISFLGGRTNKAVRKIAADDKAF